MYRRSKINAAKFHVLWPLKTSEHVHDVFDLPAIAIQIEDATAGAEISAARKEVFRHDVVDFQGLHGATLSQDACRSEERF